MNNAPVNLRFQQELTSFPADTRPGKFFHAYGESMNLLLLHQASFHGIASFYHVLSGIRTHVFVIYGKLNSWKTFTYFGNVRTINSSAYVLLPAMTYKYSIFTSHFSSFSNTAVPDDTLSGHLKSI